jgi:hypothetical protein
MGKVRSVAFSAACVVLCGCSEPLYLTSPDGAKTGNSYTLMAPYVTQVSNRVNVTIMPGAKGTTGMDGKPTPPGPPTVSVSVLPVPTARSFLYLKNNALFATNANVGVGMDGLLTSSDTASAQQVTSILTELAQTAGVAVGAKLVHPAPGKPSTDRDTCIGDLQKLVSSGPAYGVWDYTGGQATVSLPPGASSTFFVQLATPTGIQYTQENVAGERDGILAYYPVPTTATLFCAATAPKGGEPGNPLQMSADLVIYPYLDSHFVNVQRDGLTSPTDTLTFNQGFLTGHKYTNQSSAKTVVDTITAPVRALLPSVSVTQSTQIQTGGGKPDQTTSTTQSTSSPPKGP